MATIHREHPRPVVGTPVRDTVNTLGEVLAQFRKRRRRPISNTPLTQEDLALVCATDQAHICRIENDRVIPQLSTLVRICDALELSRPERVYVLSLAGHQEIVPLPDRRAVDRVLAKIVPTLESLPYPGMLVDEGERMWHYNRIAVALYGDVFRTRDQQAFLPIVRGKRALELIFFSDVWGRWKSYWEDPEAFLTRLVALFWRAYRSRQFDPDLTQLVQKLKRHAEFLWRWEKVDRGEVDTVFIEYAKYGLCHPQFGTIRYNTWRTHVAVDERFFVTHCTPINSASSRVFDQLAKLCRTR